MNQNETPLFDALLRHVARNPRQFHIPGHKKGRGMDSRFRAFVGDNALALDLINIAPLDDLHHPTGAIRHAQELAAEAFGADYTFFSVQGTSTAIMTMVMATVGPGDKILVPRNVHKSVLTAIILADATPVFLHPEVDREFGISHGLSVETVARALEEHPDARALVVINPTYFGIAADLERIVEVAHGVGVPVLVDEAHGVHIGFHPDLPLSAMQAGADMAATSVHKLGGSMTGSSVLNVREGMIDPRHVQVVLSMLTTTSTSYLLLASLDVARKELAIHGRERLDYAISLASKARRAIQAIPGLQCLDERQLVSSATYALDPTKLTISVRDLGLTGYDVERILREEYNIEVELSDLYNILCIISWGDTEEDIEALIQALEAIAERYGQGAVREHQPVTLPSMPELRMTPRSAFYARTEVVPLQQAVGRTMAEMVMVYPPGIPILLPGEVITQDNIDYIEANLRAGLPVQGPDDPEIRMIKVVRD
ncbi:aminotransferase class I/II-fold pyridoxal phosphate-dependent enzyme [Alicyclobacillus mali]|uniref:Aminotransferase class I/II-fold pyridoxal phosphate-dependent enzyme n=1 Tax=Alicyclobacillus mali (ex Roth et al. 2021) TaxID=1123961 RepID=A0ABS0F157_9BACL|nr:aminotransferase class I/II-fold pyridoxal phosphate-dependent enzyme [Alicyclobacillus mali (ex Roth et al. 2021)]MBF8377046.1 aminotransferase class I/II-fold pyridoxal phosphate-dependent enzyme [Alicyclobacillus mali (ex Roth et al. 2021)]MCL6488359.1 aminotransferase class I/II-fold pyridoxal phosphate-dependent enzyme [Alicyclobacillus mali (ex Roth et al. 2021)]